MFTISAKKNAKGELVYPNPKYTSGLTRYHLPPNSRKAVRADIHILSFAGPFDCDIELRFPEKAAMLKAWEERAEAEFALADSN